MEKMNKTALFLYCFRAARLHPFPVFSVSPHCINIWPDVENSSPQSQTQVSHGTFMKGFFFFFFLTVLVI